MSLFDTNDEFKEPPCAIETLNTQKGLFICKHKETLRDVLPKVEKDRIYHFATAGSWSTHDLIFHLSDMLGPFHLIGATWSMANHTVELFLNAIEAKILKSMHFLVDWRVQVRTPNAYNLMKFNDNVNLKVCSCHAKVAVLEFENCSCAIVGSANFTSNPRMEAGVIDTTTEAAQFHKSWILAEMKGAKPFGIDGGSMHNANWR